MTYLLAFPVALVSSLVFTPLTRALAVRYSLFDIPDGERFHSSPIPLLGGVAVVASILVGGLITYASRGPRPGVEHAFLAAGLMLSFALGVYDDRRGMGARWKIGGQAVCALLLVTGCYVGGWVEGKYLFPILVVWVVGMMNAINFLDNMDGIAGGVLAVTSFAFLLLLFAQQHWIGTVLAGALCGASLGFLRSNFPPASIFLGDAGSLPMGYLLGALSIMAAGHALPGSLFPPIIILGYPLFDITFVTVVRVREKRHVYLGGKDHSSHRFAALWDSPRTTALIIYLICLGLAITAILVEHVQHLVISISVVAILALLFVLLGVRLAKVSTDVLS